MAVSDVHFPFFAKLYSAGNPHNPSGKNFQDWNVADLRALSTPDLQIIRAMAAEKDPGLDKFIPKSFFAGHGEGEARADFERAILRESARRGDYEGFAQAALQGRYGYKAQLRSPSCISGSMSRSTRIAASMRDKSARHVKLSPQQIYSYDMAADMATQDTGDSNIRPDVARAIGAANRGLLPQAVIDQLFTIHLGDEAAYDIGYSLRADPAFTSTLPTKLAINDPKQQKMLPAFVADVFDPNKTDGDIRSALAAGWMQADIDVQKHFTSTDNKPYDFPPAPTPHVPVKSGARANGSSVPSPG
ncbi:MAG: hypothetical protein WDN72_01450 [Alphaproteobacteria bacterium]